MTPKIVTGADLLGTWLTEVTSGTPPVRYTVPSPFELLDVRPGRLMLFGGQPGGGKTAALMQIGIDLLRADPAARLLVANVEMTPALLVERVASRLSGVPLTAIADRTLTVEQTDRLRIAVAALAPVACRLAFLEAPYTLEHVAEAGDEFKPGVLVLDYIQRFGVGGPKTTDKREQLDTAVATLRGFCDAGAAVLVAAAVARQSGRTGSNYANLSLASFRGSSELEYGCDAAYVLVPDGAGGVNFQCEKNRYGPTTDIATRFDGAVQTFTPAPCGIEAFGSVPPAPTRGKAKGGTPCGN
jgi:replicative DNA helicase